jgi:hypothetical protein
MLEAFEILKPSSAFKTSRKIMDASKVFKSAKYKAWKTSIYARTPEPDGKRNFGHAERYWVVLTVRTEVGSSIIAALQSCTVAVQTRAHRIADLPPSQILTMVNPKTQKNVLTVPLRTFDSHVLALRRRNASPQAFMPNSGARHGSLRHADIHPVFGRRKEL